MRGCLTEWPKNTSWSENDDEGHRCSLAEVFTCKFWKTTAMLASAICRDTSPSVLFKRERRDPSETCSCFTSLEAVANFWMRCMSSLARSCPSLTGPRSISKPTAFPERFRMKDHAADHKPCQRQRQETRDNCLQPSVLIRPGHVHK